MRMSVISIQQKTIKKELGLTKEEAQKMNDLFVEMKIGSSSENKKQPYEQRGLLKKKFQQQKKPLIHITPQKSWYDIELKEIWRRRDLLWLMILKSIRLRYRQTFLGVAWTILQPLIPMLIFSLVFNKYFSSPNDKMSYSVFVYSGLILWLYFSNAVTHAGNSLSSQSYLLGKIYFPRFILPLAAVVAGTLDFCVGCTLLLGSMAASGFKLKWQMIFIVPLFLMTAAFALAIGTLFASLSIIYRDLRNILPYLLQLGLFLTPIVYPPENIPERWRLLFKLNPMASVVNSFRSVLTGELPIWNSLFASFLIIAGLLILAMIIFVRMEKNVADYI